MEAADPASVEDALERRLRRIVRVVFYPVAIALIALAWQHHRQPAASATPFAVWDDAAGLLEAHTVDGKLVAFDAALTYHCPGQPPVRWRWSSGRQVSHLTQHGSSVHGTEGPDEVMWRGTRWHGRIVTTIRATIGSQIHAKLSSRIDMVETGTRYAPRVCRSGTVAFTLHRR